MATDYVTGFGDRLTSMAWSPDGRLFVNEKGGRVRVVKNGSLLSQSFLAVSVDTTSERGLTGIAFDPNFGTNRFVYVYYTTASTLKNRVSRFRASASSPDTVESGSEFVLLDNIPSDSGMHNGGALHFGPDGKLYVAVGDSGTGLNAQNLGILPGKILRLNADGTVPNDNPFYGQANRRGEIWAYGLRNPFTFAFQPGTGRMFINDVGGDTWEEIDEGFRGANYGWPTCEGTCSNPGFVNPIHAYPHSGSGAAVTGGVFYSGSRFPAQYVNDYLFGDYVGHWIKRYDLPTAVVTDFASDMRYVVDLSVGPDGALYWLSVESRKVGRIDYGSPPTPTPTPAPTPPPVGQPPVPTISQPTSGTTYRAGDHIAFSGSATDPEDGTLGANRLTWEVVFHHNTHTHPFVGPISGTTAGSFDIPTSGEASADTWFRVHLVATDSDGNSIEGTRDVVPLTSNVTLSTSPSGLTVLLDGSPVTTPYTFTGVQSFPRQLTAPATQSLAGRTYQFVSWSNGGAADQTYVTPAASATVTATYVEVPPQDPPPGTTVVSDNFTRTTTNGWGNANIGGSYTLQGLTTNFNVGGGTGNMVLPNAGNSRGALLGGVNARDVDIRVRVRTNKLANGGSQYAYLVTRASGNSAYRPKIILSTNGTVSAHSGVMINGTESSLGTAVAVAGLTHAANTFIWLRAQVVGANPTTIRVKAWADGQAEPANWQFTATNSAAAVQGQGGIGVDTYMSSTNNNAPVTFSFDDLAAVIPGTPPPAPTANFTSSQVVNTLTVNFSDTSTGSPTSWSWNFGDGTNSTQQNPSKTYAAAGTYIVTLTASNAGGSNGTTKTVAVTQPPPVAAFAADVFSRTTSNGWGNADTGGPYSLLGTAANFSVGSGVGSMVVPSAGTTRSAMLSATSAADVDTTFRLRANKVAAGGAYFIYAASRVTGNNEYRPRLLFNANGTISAHASLMVNGTESPLGNAVVVSGLNQTAGGWIRFRAQVTGANPTTIRVKAWADGITEPTGWNYTTANSAAALQGGGSVGLRVYTNSTITNAPVTFGFDDYSVTTTAPPAGSVTVLAAGDIAGCSSPGDEATAALLAANAGTIVIPGDIAYENGSTSDFNNCFNPSWGPYKSRMMPAPGNHEYNTSGAAPYFAYFGAAAGDPTKGYYAYNLGAWRMYALNSNCSAIGGCGAGSAQEQWLRADLAANPTGCVAAYWHHPLFSSGDGSSTARQALFQALYDANADLVLVGHDHDYERFAPQTATGVADATRGIRQFVVGTGGVSHYTFPGPFAANSEVRNDTTYGLLKLTLTSTSYSWQFLPEAGRTFTDSGSTNCH